MPEPYRSFQELLASNARRFADKVYLHAIEQQKQLTYGELHAVGNRIAVSLTQRGLGAGDRVLLFADNTLESVAAYLGILRHGATVAIVNHAVSAAQVADILAAVAPALVLHETGLPTSRLGAERDSSWVELGSFGESGGLLDEISGLPADEIDSCAAADDPAVIFYTSGTEAKAKGVIYTHRTLFCNFDAVADMIALTDADRLLDFRAISWISAQELALGAPLLRGASVLLARHFSASRYFDWLQRFDVTVGVSVPTAINMLLNTHRAVDPPVLTHLRFMTSSSAPLLESEWRRFEDTYGITVAQGYGSSEGGWISGSHNENRRIGTVGKPLKYQHVRIVDPAGKELPTETTGEIVVAGGLQQASGYLTTSGAVEPMPADGVHTGDLGFLDRDGYLHVTGRAKELIIRGGVNVAPVEIDEVLARHPAVAEAAAIGVADPIYGEEVFAYVIANPGQPVNEAALLAHCQADLGEFKAPKAIRFVEVLPKTARGKLDRAALRREWSAGGRPGG